MHGLDGFACSAEEEEHFALGEVGAVEHVGVYGILEVAALCVGLGQSRVIGGSMSGVGEMTYFVQGEEEVDDLAVSVWVLNDCRVLRKMSESTVVLKYELAQ